MALPALIEIVPLDKPVRAEVTVPGSKSITNRALILAAVAAGDVELEGALWSEDTQVMVECLQRLGFAITVTPDPEEASNRTIAVRGRGGQVLLGGTEERPLELFVGNAGTAARFLAAFVCLGQGVFRLHGLPRMHERPQAELFAALRQLGYEVRAEHGNEKLPARILGGGAWPGRDAPLAGGASPSARPAARSCSVSIKGSSQFASALLLCAQAGGWKVEIQGENSEESPYVAMTTKLIEAFPARGGRFQIEADASSACYFLAAGMLAPEQERLEFSPRWGVAAPTTRMSSIGVANRPSSGWQIDEHFDLLWVFWHMEPGKVLSGQLAADARSWLGRRAEMLEGAISRAHDLGDSIMMAIVLAPYACKPTRFTDLGRLRVQECERVAALRTELTRCGANVVEEADMLTVFPSQLHGAEIETYHDHRMAMCFAILGLKVPGIRIKNPACVKKTFPNFFQKLAAAPPRGLGATILDGATGRRLSGDELFAE